VVRIEIAGNAELLIRDLELNPEKLGEVANDGWIGISESNRMSSLVALGPVEHAPGDIKGARVLNS